MTRQNLDLDRGERPTVDFIVVGAGSAGSAVAARLAQSSSATHVALIEAGPAKASLLSDVPLGIAALVPLRTRRNYAYETAPQPGFGGRQGLSAARTWARRLEPHQCDDLYARPAA